MLRIAQTALAFSYIKQGKNAAPSRSSLPPSFPPLPLSSDMLKAIDPKQPQKT